MTLVSPCCGAEVHVVWDAPTETQPFDEWFECEQCGKPCDPIEKKPTEAKQEEA